MAASRRSGIGGWSGLVLAVAIARVALALDPTELGSRAGEAPVSDLPVLVRELTSAPELSSADAEWLLHAADAWGALVARARELRAPPASFRALDAAGDDLAHAVRGARSGREESAGEDERALEALYRSTDWQRLGYAAATVDYWQGWTRLGLGQGLPAGTERERALVGARAAFGRSARALSRPSVARGSLLGLGLAHLELGNLEQARSVLERLDSAVATADPDGLRTQTRQLLVAVHARSGDLEQATRLAETIPRDSLDDADRIALLAVETEALLQAVRGGRGDPDRAAEKLRALGSAGGDGPRRASALAVRYRPELGDRRVGPISDLLDADEAFRQERWAAARDAYARVLAAPEATVGMDEALARYRYAVALQRTGALDEAASQLERALDAAGDDRAAARRAAIAWQAVSEQRAIAEPGARAEAEARRAARALLRVAPDAPSADTARVRMARALEDEREPRAAIRELEQVPADSDAYSVARLELARLRGATLQGRENAGGAPDVEEARRLAQDLDEVGRLVEAGRVSLDPGQGAALGVLRAKASAWAGDDPETVRIRVTHARDAPGLDEGGRRALLRLELGLSLRSRDWRALDRLLEGLDDAALRRDRELYTDLLLRLPRRPGAAPTWERWYLRVEPLAADGSREALRLARAERLLAEGRAAESAEVARSLVDADPAWADASILLARALEASGDATAPDAWGRVAAGVEEGSPSWIEAQVARARVAASRQDWAAACESMRRLESIGAEGQSERRADLEELGRRCLREPEVQGSQDEGKR